MTNEELITICKAWRDRSIELTNKEIVDGAEDAEIYDAIIKALEYKRWIPVSERLPEKVGTYLLSLYIEAPVCNPLNRVVKGYWTTSNKFQFETEFGVIANYYVKAWMPLPEPYMKEVEND